MFSTNLGDERFWARPFFLRPRTPKHFKIGVIFLIGNKYCVGKCRSRKDTVDATHKYFHKPTCRLKKNKAVLLVSHKQCRNTLQWRGRVGDIRGNRARVESRTAGKRTSNVHPRGIYHSEWYLTASYPRKASPTHKGPALQSRTDYSPSLSSCVRRWGGGGFSSAPPKDLECLAGSDLARYGGGGSVCFRGRATLTILSRLLLQRHFIVFTFYFSVKKFL